MSLYILRQLVRHTSLLQANWTLARVEILHVCQLMLLLVLVEDSRQRTVLLHELFLTVSELTPFEVVHDVEVLRAFVLQIELVDDLIVWLGVVDDVPPVVVVGEDVLGRIDKHFDLVAHFDLEAYERHVELVVEDHAHFFELEAFEFLALERHAVQLVLDACEVVELPLSDLVDSTDFACLLLDSCA